MNPRASGINRLNWDRAPLKALPRVATTPNATTLYGVGMFDLQRNPRSLLFPKSRIIIGVSNFTITILAGGT